MIEKMQTSFEEMSVQVSAPPETVQLNKCVETGAQRLVIGKMRKVFEEMEEEVSVPSETVQSGLEVNLHVSTRSHVKFRIVARKWS